MSLCIEAGKPIKDSRGEVTRLIDTFRIAAEESVRMTGEVMNLEISPRARGYRGMCKRVPIGPCSFISPFNFPLNLAAHKVAPALAVGCPFVLKPASRTPIGALIIGEVLAETDLPRRRVLDPALPSRRCRSVHHGRPSEAAQLYRLAGRRLGVKGPGGQEEGRARTRAATRRVIVDADADLDDATERIVFGAFYQSGQSCIGVQRIIVHESIYDELRDRLVAATQTLAGRRSRRTNRRSSAR